MTGTTIDFGRLARLLPDLPRWIEVRSMLLSGRCEVFGLEEEPQPRFAICNSERELTGVVGRANRVAVDKAMAHVGRGKGVAICPFEDSDYLASLLPDRTPSPVALHLLGDNARMPEVPPGAVRLVVPEELSTFDHLPPALKDELKIVAPHCLIAATIVDQLPVAFCYVAWETDSLWDVSIETLAEHRGRGYAALSVAFLVEYMKNKGKNPVWGAEESNLPSMQLAAKLGFVKTDRLVLFHPPGGRRL